MAQTKEKKVMERKLRKVGNSLAVTIPMEVLQQIGLKEGDTIEFSPQGEVVTLKKKEEVVTEAFMALVKEICDENDEALKELVNR